MYSLDGTQRMYGQRMRCSVNAAYTSGGRMLQKGGTGKGPVGRKQEVQVGSGGSAVGPGVPRGTGSGHQAARKIHGRLWKV